MLCTTAAQSVSKNITCTSVRMRGVLSFGMRKSQAGRIPSAMQLSPRLCVARRAALQGQLRENCCRHFLRSDRFHAAEVDRTLAQEAGTAFDMVTNDGVPGSDRARQARFG